MYVLAKDRPGTPHGAVFWVGVLTPILTVGGHKYIPEVSLFPDDAFIAGWKELLDAKKNAGEVLRKYRIRTVPETQSA